MMRNVILCAMVLVTGGLVQAATYRFVGTVDNLWSNIGNWTVDGNPAPGLPGENDDVRINASCLLDYDAGVVNSLQIGSGGPGDLTVDGGDIFVSAGGGLGAVGWDSEGMLTINSGTVHFTENMTIGCWANKGTLIMNGGRLWSSKIYLSIYDDGGVFADSLVQLNRGVIEAYYIEIKGGQFDIGNGQLLIWYDDAGVQQYIANGFITAFDGEGTVIFDPIAFPSSITAEHNMHPAPDFYEVVPAGVVELSWDNLDPNHPGASVIVDVWFGTDPNRLGTNYQKVLADEDVTDQIRSSVLVNAPQAGLYYWQVDTDNGADPNNKTASTVFVFEATVNLPPKVDAGSNMITWVGEPVLLNPAITDDGATPLMYAWVANNPTAVFSDPAIETPTVTLDNAAGDVMLTLTVDDGFNPPVSDTLVITVYQNACQAARIGAQLAAAYPEDLTADCMVGIEDFAAMAIRWLENYALTQPVAVP